MKNTLSTILAVVWISMPCLAQDFINLDFEHAVVQPSPPGSTWLDWSLAAPGWVHSDGDDTSHVFYNNSHLGQTAAYTLIDSNASWPWPQPLQGEYSLLFRNGDFSCCEPGPWVNAFIAQTGLVPADSRSVRFLATGIFGVFINGIEIPTVSLGGDAHGADITLFAGTVAELKIQNIARPVPFEGSVPVLVDAIEFSPVAIPEPSAFALLSLAGLVFAGRVVSRRSGARTRSDATR